MAPGGESFLSDVFRARVIEAPAAPFLTRQRYYDWLVVGVVCTTGFLGQLDASIVQLALPTLSREFGVPVGEVRWVAVAYLLSYASLVLVFGQISDAVGRKFLYLAGFATFTVGSLLCGVVSDIRWLVFFRVVQGIGGALFGANSIAILVATVDSSRRAQGIGFFTAAQAIGISAGPALGGVLLDLLDWRWVFWVAVPIALTGAVLGWFTLPPLRHAARDKRLDWPGALLIVPCLVSGILVLNQVSVWRLSSVPMFLLIAAAFIFFVLFVRRERVAPWPLIQPRLFASASFVAGSVGVVLGFALLYGMFFLMSFALMHGFHDSAMLAGLKLAVIPVAIGLMAPLGIARGKLHGERLVCAGGMALSGIAVLALSIIANHPIGSLVTGLSAFAVFGMGLGFFLAPNNDATIEAAPADLSGQAAALLNLLRVIGSSIGVSAASSMMLWRLQERDTLFGGRPMIDAVEASLGLLVVFAVAGVAAALVQSHKPKAA